MRAALLTLSTLVLAACNMTADAQRGDSAPATGSGAQRSFQVAAFDQVSLGGPHNVIVTVGGAPSVRAEGEERELERLEIRVEGGRLHIGQRQGSNWSLRGNHSAVTVHVTVPSLSKAAIGGSGDMRIDTVQGRAFEAAIGGSGDIEIGSLRVEEARFSVAGSGNIRVAGQAARSHASIAGSGDIDASTLESRTAEVSIVGSGDVSMRAMETADVSVMGSGDVTVTGPARCTVRKMGSGEVTCNA